jgi:DNA mismatch repair protein PMS2
MSVYLRPQPLELTAADEMLAIENMDVLQRNGFEVDVDEVTTSGLAHRLKLVAQPVSKSTVFDMKGQQWLMSINILTLPT